jgi:hypothetical protein
VIDRVLFAAQSYTALRLSSALPVSAPTAVYTASPTTQFVAVAGSVTGWKTLIECEMLTVLHMLYVVTNVA